MCEINELRSIIKNDSYAITFDTCSFKELKYAFSFSPLRKMNIFKEMGLKVVMSEVVINEVKFHLQNEFNDYATKINASFKGIVKSTNKRQDEFSDFFDYIKSCKNETFNIVDNFINNIATDIVKINDFKSLDDVFKMYFSNIPPFGTSKERKNEFPDAIAIKSIEQWGKSNSKKIIAVTSDKGWVEFCEKSSTVYVVKNIIELLNLYEDNSAFFAVELKQYLLSETGKHILESIFEAFKEGIEETSFDVDNNSSDRSDCDVGEVTVESFDDFSFFKIFIEGVNDNIYDVSIFGTVNVKAELFVDFFVWDSIDREMINMGGKTYYQNESLSCNMSLSFEKINSNWNIMCIDTINIESLLTFEGEISELYDDF